MARANEGVVFETTDGRCGACGTANFTFAVTSTDGVSGYCCVACGAVKREDWRTRHGSRQYGFTDNGAFVVIDHARKRASYAYPTSPRATKAALAQRKGLTHLRAFVDVVIAGSVEFSCAESAITLAHYQRQCSHKLFDEPEET